MHSTSGRTCIWTPLLSSSVHNCVLDGTFSYDYLVPHILVYSLDYDRRIFDIRRNGLTKEGKWGEKKGTEEQTLGSLTSRVYTYNEIYHLFKEDYKKCSSINISREQKSQNGISLGNYISKSERYSYDREIGFLRKLSLRRLSEISVFPHFVPVSVIKYSTYVYIKDWPSYKNALKRTFTIDKHLFTFDDCRLNEVYTGWIRRKVLFHKIQTTVSLKLLRIILKPYLYKLFFFTMTQLLSLNIFPKISIKFSLQLPRKKE